MTFIIGLIIGCFVGGAAVFLAFALVAAGSDEEAARKWERWEDDLK